MTETPRQDEATEEAGEVTRVETDVSVSRPPAPTEAPAPTEEALEAETADTEPEAAQDETDT